MTRVRFPSPAPSGFGDQAKRFRPCGSVVEHSLGKGEVAGPIPAKGTSFGARNASCAPSVLVVDRYFSESKNGKRQI